MITMQQEMVSLISDDINTVLFNSIFTGAPYDARYDYVPDGVIDIADIFAVALRFGSICP